MYPWLLFVLFWHALFSVSHTAESSPQPFVQADPGIPVRMDVSDYLSQVCNCSITQDGNTYPISALQGTVSAAAFYSYGVPSGSSANTGLELPDCLVIFLYEDTNTGVISIFLIADIAGDGTGGSLEFEINCLPATAFISVQDDAGEFFGSPPLVTGDWTWSGCCTDGGVIEDIGCNNTINLDLLIASGIDSIVWLTGDIANPDHILLALSGEAISISCGSGGICCPVGFDTDVLIANATCPDTPNGSINLNPQDGIPPYAYNWSNGESTPLITGLLPGAYDVTVTDSQGCSEELQINVGVSPGDPPAFPAMIDVCSETIVGDFDLTSVNATVNGNSGSAVLWFENVNMTGAINTPSSYSSESTTVYAVVNNGSCLSDPVPVVLTVLQSPFANPASLHACEESNDMATFDLTELEVFISGGNGNVLWYHNNPPSNPINNPGTFVSTSVTIYAVVDDGVCTSMPVEVELTVDPKPEGISADMHLCGDDANEAVFDLTLLDLVVSDGNGTVAWYKDLQLNEPVFDPAAFQTTSGIVYAAVFDGICYSDPVPVQLIVDPTPVGAEVTLELCDDGSSMVLIDLTDYEFQVAGGSGGVDWYLDEFLFEPISSPTSFLTEAAIIYATVDNGICVSEPVPFTILLQENIEGNPTSLETCADSTGQGAFNLSSVENIVSGGVGMVQWFEDASGNFPIGTPASFSTSGTTVYAQIVNGVCLSELIPVELIIISTVSATSTQYAVCDDGSGISLFDLTTIENAVSNNTGQVSWYIDSLATMPIFPADSFPSSDTTVYARVTAGTCVSDVVPVQLMVLPTPTSVGQVVNLCGDTNSLAWIDLTALDTLVSGNLGNVSWYGDANQMQLIPNPMAFQTGDTVVYALVYNGACYSLPATVVIAVADGLEGDPQILEYCIPLGDTLWIDLTQLDADISGGIYNVNWFSDSLGTIPIPMPTIFPVVSSAILYAQVTDGVCASEPVPIDLNVIATPIAHPYTVSECGSLGEQVLFDLIAIDSFIGENSGSVNWYVDAGLTSPIQNPGSFSSGDSVVYATVTNGFCVSPVVAVTLDVTDSLMAHAIRIQKCVLNGDTATVNLTLFNPMVSGGTGTVIWFRDSLGLDTIKNPGIFITAGDTVYAVVLMDDCQSDIAMIPIDVAGSAFPQPTCQYTSIDSIAVNWSAVNDNFQLVYSINGMPMGLPQMTQQNEFHLGGLGQGDTLIVWVTALFDSICTTPLTDSVMCITDVCPEQLISFPGLGLAYCRDDPAFSISVNPPGGQLSGPGITGNTFTPDLVVGSSAVIQYVWNEITSGCMYDTTVTLQIADPLLAPELSCGTPNLSEVTFDWNTPATSFGLTYTINSGPVIGPLSSIDSSLRVDQLMEGDSVSLMIWSLGLPPCGNSDTVSLTCYTKVCPPATIAITDPGIICSQDDPISLEAVIQGLPGTPDLTWSGTGVSDPSGIFDPALAVIGINRIALLIDDIGCVYDTSIDLTVQPQPVSLFDVKGTPCLDSSLLVVFTGEATDVAQFMWHFSGGDTVTTHDANAFYIHWSQAGNYILSLSIQDEACLSQPFSLPITIDEPLEDLVLTCLEEDYHSLTIEWAPVPGATQYQATSTAGAGVLQGTTYTLHQLKDNLVVTITITASGPSSCGPVIASIDCQTLEFIPPRTFIPNIFSPNQDGINDVFYVQANPEVTTINAFRIFDRWGNLVFERFNFQPDDPFQGWDGKFEGQPMNPDVFTYWIEYETAYETTETKAGDVTLIR